MKKNQSVARELARLEQGLASDIALLAQQLGPLPDARDTERFEEAWNAVASSRRRLALFVSRQQRDGRPASGARDASARSDRDALQSATSRLRHWGRFETLTRAQLHPQRIPLIRAPKGGDDNRGVMDHIVTLFLDALHTIANPDAEAQSKEAMSRGFHKDIPLPMSQFSALIAAAYRVCLAQRKEGPLRFLDVGSGGGTKVLAATTCFDVCHGLEYEETIASTGADLLGLLAPQTCTLMQGDGLTFDDYGAYDVIFTFRPIGNFEQMRALEERIIAQARPGTVLLMAAGFIVPDLAEKQVQRLADMVYVTEISELAAEALRAGAERMGTMVPGHGRRPRSDLGYWQPLADACDRNGYRL